MSSHPDFCRSRWNRGDRNLGVGWRRTAKLQDLDVPIARSRRVAAADARPAEARSEVEVLVDVTFGRKVCFLGITGIGRLRGSAVADSSVLHLRSERHSCAEHQQNYGPAKRRRFNIGVRRLSLGIIVSLTGKSQRSWAELIVLPLNSNARCCALRFRHFGLQVPASWELGGIALSRDIESGNPSGTI